MTMYSLTGLLRLNNATPLAHVAQQNDCVCMLLLCVAAGLKELRGKMNARVRDLILGWLKEKGLAPDAKSELGKGSGHKRRTLLSPLLLLAQSLHQQEQALLTAWDS